MGTVVAVGAHTQRRRLARAVMGMPGEPSDPGEHEETLPPGEPVGDPPDNWTRIAAMERTSAVRFRATNSHDPLLSQSEDRGAIGNFVPSDMFTAPARFRIDTVVGNADGVTATDDAGDDYTRVVINVSRGDSTFDVEEGFAEIPESLAWVLINEDTEEWMMWPAAGGFATQTTISYSVIPSFVEDADADPDTTNVVNGIAESFSDGEDLTGGAGFQNGLRGSVLVLALLPDSTFRPMFGEEPQPQPSNYERIAALEGAFAIRVNTRRGPSDLFEESSDEGELLASTPEGMFDDMSVIWFEQLTGRTDGLDGTDDDGETYTKVAIAIGRGDSTADFGQAIDALSGDWAFVLTNERTQEWIMWPADGGTLGTNGAIVQIAPSFIDDANLGDRDTQAIAESFSDGETLTAGRTFQNALRNSEVVLGLIPDIDFRPAFSPDENRR